MKHEWRKHENRFYVPKNKPHHLLSEVKFEKITDGQCIQGMHLGSCDSESESFFQMEKYAEKEAWPESLKNIGRSTCMMPAKRRRKS